MGVLWTMTTKIKAHATLIQTLNTKTLTVAKENPDAEVPAGVTQDLEAAVAMLPKSILETFLETKEGHMQTIFPIPRNHFPANVHPEDLLEEDQACIKTIRLWDTVVLLLQEVYLCQ